ncbi:tetratricopeptide repeat protein [Streptomyces katsurahamanus]|uniref:Tetratricopeptide repeat protein n=1 Tax=Streptomyces katsurahamanus TaxID=2577098 RepID=A0ABW9NPM6_9ACTN|nr:tetratricopeptide repeat protein [Streptomyces katsurahamanus]MQS35223.1 tetratricopeptide repeat protein [Streptomyces katsurahamanus]
MATREPNERLERLHREAGWTHRQFAQAVNRVGTERGTPTKYQQPSVSQWLHGHIPKKETRPLILEALERKLRRPITYAAAGFPAPGGDSGTRSTVAELVDLGTADALPGRRLVVGASLFSVALTIPDWQDVVGRMESVKYGSTVRIGMPDVEVVTKMTERLNQMYGDFGGRTARPLAATFLVNEVVPYLHADATETVRKEMLSAASFLCYLTGWMAADEGLHGLAQRYYTKGLELAGASSDHLTYCHVLRGMSVQAADLGHGPTAVRLAEAASAASPQTGPRMRAFMGGQLAHSYALAGDGRAALRSIRETEKALDAAESGLESFGGFSPATLAYATAQVRYYTGDITGSVESLKLHFQLRDPTDTKVSGLRFGSMLAERQLELGHLEAACTTWNEVLDRHSGVRSGRVDRQVADITSRLRPYISNGTAREFDERVVQQV